MVRKISIILFTILFLTGCSEEFLNNPPKGQLTSGNFPTTEQDAVLAVNGAYNTLRIWNFHAGGFPILDIMSDEAKKGSNPGDGIVINDFENFTFTPGNGSFERWWSTSYQGIKRAHLVLEDVPAIDMDPQLKSRILAEARFLRGFFYFTLVRAYGDVPKITSSEPPQNMPRTDKEEIYNDLIIPDFEYAIENLPVRSDYASSEVGRATKGAARGMLAKAYLWRGNYELAAQYALDLINSGQYSLDPNYSDVFNEAFGPGAILEVGALPRTGMGNGGNQYANTWGVRGEPNLGWGFGRPSWSLIQDMENDPRLDPTVAFLGDTIQGITIQGDQNTPDTTYNDQNEIVQVECYNQKTFVPGTNPEVTWGYNRTFLRYADVLLVAAEALNEINRPGDARTYLNQVRERAREEAGDLPDITTTDQDALRDSIIKERHHELALEGKRYWDLVRTGKAPEVLGPLGFKEGKHERMPVPQSEINISEGAMTQNPNY
jgi:hypothetical protein